MLAAAAGEQHGGIIHARLEHHRLAVWPEPLQKAVPGNSEAVAQQADVGDSRHIENGR